ncbi:MAG: RNA-binding protein [Thermoplasmata archaeon]|nr:RNA-binding protein [Thermoplasmata archaeon]
MIKWYGAFKIEKGKVVDEYIFPSEKREEIIEHVRKGDLSILREFIGEDEVKLEGELRDVEELQKLSISIARKEMKGALGEDYLLIEILNTYNDVVSILNLLKERREEWERIKRIKGVEDPVAEILSKEISEIERIREELYKEIERRAHKLAPNLTYLVGPIIAANLISDAGSLKRLASLPASTIQVLGAEDAFFRHLKNGSRCPKHGTIFKVAEVRNSPKKMRGKIARTLAAKIAIAARMDYYGGEFRGEELKSALKKRMEEIKK